VAASRATTVVWRALQAPATAEWLAQLLQAAGALHGQPAASLRLGPGGLWQGGQLATTLPALALALGAARPQVLIDLPADETPSPIPSAHHVFGACAALAQVAVDTWTGRLQVQHLVLASALGRVVSDGGYLGQMEGGLLIGQGMATVEALPMQAGHYLARNLDAYLVPTLADAPQLEVLAIENLLPGDASGPRGAGEISVNIAVPAIANAVSMALGRQVTALPLGPAQLLDLLEQAP
jgi:nicotinate dehydrogenase large molybdopterin subunit